MGHTETVLGESSKETTWDTRKPFLGNRRPRGNQVRFFQFVRGEDAPQFEEIRIHGSVATFDEIYAHNFLHDGEVEFRMQSSVAFTHYPGMDYVFSGLLMPELESLRQYGRIVQINSLMDSVPMYVFFPNQIQLFDSERTHPRFSAIIKQSVQSFESIHFSRGLNGTETGLSEFKGLLGGCFFSEMFVHAVVSKFRCGFYLREFVEGSVRPGYLNNDFSPLKSGDDERTMIQS